MKRIAPAARERIPLVAPGAFRTPVAAIYPLSAFHEAVAHVQRRGEVFEMGGDG